MHRSRTTTRPAIGVSGISAVRCHWQALWILCCVSWACAPARPASGAFTYRGLSLAIPTALGAPNIERDAEQHLLVRFAATARPGSEVVIEIQPRPTRPLIELAWAHDLQRPPRATWGASAISEIAGRRWLRRHFSGAAAVGVEYAFASERHLYRIRIASPAPAADALIAAVAGSLRAPPPAARWTRALDRKRPRTSMSAAVAALAATTVVVVAAAQPTPDQPPAPRAVGTGAVMDRDGRILTSLHTLRDPRGGLYDAVVIGRYQPDQPLPSFLCIGRPAASALAADLDLAAIWCDRDVRGQPWSARPWPSLTAARGPAPGPGDAVWTLGVAASHGGGLALLRGQVTGWRDERLDPAGPSDGPSGRYLTIDAAIAPGTSGAAVIDRHGAVIGIVSGYRDRLSLGPSDAAQRQRVGMVRPIALAHRLLSAAPPEP